MIKLDCNEVNQELEVFTNRIIEKTNQALEAFRYNIIIANYHEIYSYFRKLVSLKKNYKNLKNNYEKILIIMCPVIPHFTYECLSLLNYNVKDIRWPKINLKYLEDVNIEIVIQINGKKRGSIKVEKNIEQKLLEEKLLGNHQIKKYTENKKLLKIIYIKNKVINYITDK